MDQEKKIEKSSIGILYVDDELSNLTAFKATFRRYYDVYIAISAEEGIKVLEENKGNIEIIITDQRMPGMTGVEFLTSIIDKYPDTIRILLTGYADIQAVIDAVNKGSIYQYVSKPWEEQNLKVIIEKAFEVYRLRAENKELIKVIIIKGPR
jgi:response regulator RpfG family c-di-GMP phosphodiesterase